MRGHGFQTDREKREVTIQEKEVRGSDLPTMPNVLEFIVQSYEVIIVQDDCTCESRQASARSRVLPTSGRLRTSTREMKARTNDNHERVG